MKQVRQVALRRIKRILSRVGRDRYFKRRLPADLGGLWFPASLEGGAKFLRFDLQRADPLLIRFARDHVRPGMTVWDVGANVGLFAFTAAGLGAEVVAVEADIWLARNLRVAAQQPSVKVAVVPAAIAASVGLEEFVVAASNRATNYLSTASGSTMTGGVRERQLVPTLTLDSLLDHFSAPEVIKIDIEGAELMALEGGRRVLQHRPTILLEVAGQNRDGIHRILAPLGYGYVDAVTGRHCDALATANVICTAQNYPPPRAHAG